MAKEMKTYHAHGGGSFVMGFLCLLFVGTYALFALMPIFTVTVAGEVTDYTGLDYIFVGGGTYIQQFLLPDLDLEKATYLTELFKDPAAENFVINILANFHWIFSLVSAVAIAASAVLAVFVLLIGLAWLIRGRIQFPKFTRRFVGWAHGLFDTGIGALYAYIYFLSEIQKGRGEDYSAMIGVLGYVVLGIQVAIAILIGITYRICFKNRVYEKKEKNKDEEDAFYNKPAKNGQPTKQGTVPVFEKDIPPGTRSIGDHAYAGDPALTKATIPDGVTSLGSNAFANCRNLEMVVIPVTVNKIGSNCFYNTPHLKQIRYGGSKEDWRSVRRGGNWLVGAGTTTIITANGAIVVNPNQ